MGKTKLEALHGGMLGVEGRAKVEARLRMLEGGHSYQISGTGKAQAKHEKYEGKSEIEEYKTAADNTMGKKRKFDEDVNDDEEVVEKKIKVEDLKVEESGDGSEVPKKKKKKKKNKEADTEAANNDDESGDATTPAKKSKKRYSLSDCTNVPTSEENGSNGTLTESPVVMNGDSGATESAKKKKKKKK